MKRWADLGELKHSLGRARAFAEELNMPQLATYISHTLGVIQNELTQLDKIRAAQITPETPKPARKSRTVATNLTNQSEEAK